MSAERCEDVDGAFPASNHNDDAVEDVDAELAALAADVDEEYSQGRSEARIGEATRDEGDSMMTGLLQEITAQPHSYPESTAENGGGTTEKDAGDAAVRIMDRADAAREGQAAGATETEEKKVKAPAQNPTISRKRKQLAVPAAAVSKKAPEQQQEPPPAKEAEAEAASSESEKLGREPEKEEVPDNEAAPDEEAALADAVPSADPGAGDVKPGAGAAAAATQPQGLDDEQADEARAAKPASEPVPQAPAKPALTKAKSKKAVPKAPSVKKERAKKERAKSAFSFFSAAKWAEVKGENPSLKMPEVSRKLAQMWNSMSEAEKQPFQELALQDKQRLGKKTAGGRPAGTEGKPPKKAPRARNAYQLFCADVRESTKLEHPEAGLGELSKYMAAAWKEISPEERQQYELKAQEESAAQKKAAAEKPDGAAASAAPKGRKKRTGATVSFLAASSARGKSSGGAADAMGLQEAGDLLCALAEGEVGEGIAKQGGAGSGDEDSSDSDRENCDWNANPAEAICCHTSDRSKYLVKRKGLGFTEYGTVDARAAKRLRLQPDGNASPQLPIGRELLEDYDAFVSRFWSHVHSHMDSEQGLDLEELEEGSPLEMCYYLGKLLESGGILSRVSKAGREQDRWIKVPMLGISMVVQRLVDIARHEARSSCASAKLPATSLKKQPEGVDCSPTRAASMAPEV